MKRGILLFSLLFFLVSLACQTMATGLQPPWEDNFTGKPTRVPSPTPTPLPPMSTRLSGDDLPELEFAKPIGSQHDAGRPRFPDTAFSLGTDHFRLHYTNEGDDAVPEKDLDSNDLPDYVEDVAQALEYSWYAEIEFFGWAPPPSDGTIGGDDKYDIYLLNILPYGYAGYTDSDRGRSNIGDNPRSDSVTEKNSTHSYIALDNDYIEYEEFKVPGISRTDYMRSVVAHEFAHAIQFGYDGEEPDNWLWESTATWMEDQVFNDVDETIRILKGEFKSTDTCQPSQGGNFGEPDAGHWYAMWIFFRYLSERFGDSAVRNFWEQAVEHDGNAIWDAVLAEHGLTMEEFYTDFAIALLTRSFEEGDSYPTVRLEGHASGAGDFVPTDGVQQLAVDFVEILGHDVYSVELKSIELTGLLVGISEGYSYVFPMTGNKQEIDTNQFKHTYVVVLNLNRASSEGTCRSSEYIVSISPGGEPSQPLYSLPAPNFELPKVEDLNDPENLPEDLPGG